MTKEMYVDDLQPTSLSEIRGIMKRYAYFEFLKTIENSLKYTKEEQKQDRFNRRIERKVGLLNDWKRSKKTGF